MKKSKNTNQKEIFFIATRYRNNPLRVNFYKKQTGEQVPDELVVRKQTASGVRLYAQ